MTEIVVELVKVPEPIPIKDADRIEAREIGGYTVVSLKNQFKPNDLGLFISIDSVVPLEFLQHYDLDTVIKNGRVRTKRLKGIYSEGLLLPLTHPIFEGLTNKEEGVKLADALNIHKYEPPKKGATFAGQQSTRRWVAENYHVYDIENIQNPHNRNIFVEGENVAIQEKIHGMHSSYGWIGDQFFYTSRKYSLLEPEDPENSNTYWKPIELYGLKEKLLKVKTDMQLESIALRGEIYGHGVQNLTYGLDRTKNNGIDFRAFDIELNFNKYAPELVFRELMDELEIPTVPHLYHGPFSFEKCNELAELDSVVSFQNGTKQVSEGIVIKSERETLATNNRYLQARRILKQVSKRYKVSETYEQEVDDQ